MDQEILTRNLGLTDKEAAVYVAILELGHSTIKPIASRSGIKRTSIYYFINHLVELGLVEQARIRGRNHYKALPPESMVSLQKRRLEEIEQALPEFRSLFNLADNKPHISYFEGPEQIQNIVMEEVRCKEVLSIWPASTTLEAIGGTRFMERLLGQLSRKQDTSYKILRFREQEVEYKHSHDGPISKYREIRYAPAGLTFPVAIGIYDTQKVSFITTRTEGIGILIESAEIYQAMRYLFFLFWEQSQAAD